MAEFVFFSRNGQAFTNADIVASARAELGNSQRNEGLLKREPSLLICSEESHD
jgi:hypothetical protein